VRSPGRGKGSPPKRRIRKGKRRSDFMVSKFLKVKCKKCKNEQIVFEKSASVVKCLVCGEVLTDPTGGRAKLKTENVSEV
jgi:small subunit ribosomal protein S27e